MNHHDSQLLTLSDDQLVTATGGDGASIGAKIGGFVDQFTGNTGKGAQVGGQIGGFVQNLIGQFGGGGAPAGGAQ
jgi:hypothetical protein